MQKRPLGTSGIDVSVLCLGSMNWGDQNTEREGHAQIDRALDAGVNFIDTAELYAIPPLPDTQGRSEEILGTWLQRSGRRADIVLATKVVGRSKNTWFRADASPARLTRAQINEAIDASLRRLRTDYVDLYQVHWPDRDISAFGGNPTVWKGVDRHDDETPIDETLDALTDLVKSGKVRAIGLSNESAWGTMRYLQASDSNGTARVQSIQNAYSLVNRTFETGLAEIADREKVGLLAYSPLAQGFLTGKYLNGARPRAARRTLFNRQQRYEKPGSQEAYAAYVDLAQASGMTPAQLALAFVASRSFTTSVIIGATTLEQLDDDLSAAAIRLDSDLETAINAIHQRHCNPAP